MHTNMLDILQLHNNEIEDYCRGKGSVAYNPIWEVQKHRSETDASQIKAAAAPALMPVIASNAKHISGSRMHGGGQVAYAPIPRIREAAREGCDPDRTALLSPGHLLALHRSQRDRVTLAHVPY